nr:hypothetical protein [uncultured Cetobacterium sp.]
MKKINIAIGIVLLSLMGCKSVERVPTEEKIVLPTVAKKAPTVTITTMDEQEFVPQTNIITADNSKTEDELEKGILDIKFDGIKYVEISKKRYKNKIAYNGDSKEPFTGTFASAIGVHKHYTEDYIDGKLDGYKTWYSDFGTVGVKEPYKDGKKDGIQETFYEETGKIRSRISYREGRVNGIVEWYDEKGNILDKQELKDGNGRWKAFWDNGIIREEGELKNGYPIGEWREYTSDGQLHKVSRYKNGARIYQEWYQ